MKKILPIFLILVLLVSCSQVNDENVTKQDNNFKLNLELITPQNGLIWANTAGTEDGCYELLIRTDSTASILYYDYKTQQKIYLSSQPNSVRDETNTSFIDNILGGAMPMIAGEKLYVFKLGSPFLTESTGEIGKPYILQMDLNGSNRKKMDFTNEYSFYGSSAVASDGENLYCLMTVSNTNSNDVANMRLQKINVSNNSIETLQEFDIYDNLSICGTYSEGLVFIRTHFISTNGNSMSTQDSMNNRRFDLVLFSFDTKEETVLKSWTLGELTYTIHDGYFYFIDSTSQNLKKLDFETKATEILTSDLGLEHMNYDSAGIYSYVFDNKIITRLYNSQTQESWMVGIDIDTKKAYELVLYFGEPGDERLVGIFEENEDYFLVHIGDKTIHYRDIGPNGVEYDAEMILLDYALISKDDYWNGIPNYLYFSDNVFS